MIRTDPVTGAFGLKITFKLTSILNAKLTKKIISKCFNLIPDNYKHWCFGPEENLNNMFMNHISSVQWQYSQCKGKQKHEQNIINLLSNIAEIKITLR